ncbi:ER chaperone Rot1 [Schizosaccharomyces cryophilus OY26]|uniref:Protein ROT1 n=1 Tax=Schizosaccharomyces cryophilus (strain OY26 / ATCC MYA-4695 / CBS 11777 / NBRC 106824 / NRRL Y48691) TaxID=653667 RepID=S9W5P4_SCHCR|nr:ER chaperone Rot1 [Schizosaccharomyces cryophilus OY26]EPY53305.1 ER chaperone Rot1 [Schizosaccharomyces cryophilus OY26]
MILPLSIFFCSFLWIAKLTKADQSDPDLVGTWSSKSQTVMTGPDFFDPLNEDFFEPDLPGISYSFTDDGHFEEALYIIKPNASVPHCPKGFLQWQHGTYSINDSKAIILSPIKGDGRQLESDPCNNGDHSVYTRYTQDEVMKEYAVSVDKYHGRYKLQLYEWDGTPKQPMYLVYRPPKMLPTTFSGASDSNQVQQKRWLLKYIAPLADKHTTTIWWLGLTFIAVGSIGYLIVS